MTMERARTGPNAISSPRAASPPKRNRSTEQKKGQGQQQKNSNEVDLFSAKTIQVNNLPVGISKETLMSAFASYGQITGCQQPDGETFAYIMFKKNVASKKAEEASGSIDVDGNSVEVARMSLPVANPGPNGKQNGLLETPGGQAPLDKSKAQADNEGEEDSSKAAPVALVENVCGDHNEDTLRELFENNFGQVLRVNMVKDQTPMKAYIEFSKMDSMQKAVEACQQQSSVLVQANGDAFKVTHSISPGKKARKQEAKQASQNFGRQPSAGIYVTRLGEDCTEQNLYDAFAKFGRVTDVFLIRDENKNSRNSAFVDFVDVKSATKAVETKGFEIEGRKVDVKFKHNTLKPEGCMSVYVRNVPPATTEASITAAFKKFGEIKGVQVLKDRAVAFVHFDNPDIVEKLVSVGRVQLHGEQVVVRYNTRDTKTGAKPAPKTSRENSDSSKQSRPEGCTKVYVSHLSTETTEQGLRDVFAVYGELERIFILRELSTGVSKGVAFIDFKDPEAAERAVNAAGEMKIDGRQPVVRYKVVDKPQKAEGCSNTVFAANLASETTEATLFDHCKQYGDIESVHLLRDPVTGVSRGKGFIMFRDDSSVDKAVAGSGARIDGKVILFRCVQPAYAQNRREKPPGCVSVFVSNLSKHSSINSLAQHFNKYGPVANVSIVSSGPSSRRVAFVTFKQTDSVDLAVRANGELVDGHHVVIRYGDGNEKGGKKPKDAKGAKSKSPDGRRRRKSGDEFQTTDDSSESRRNSKGSSNGHNTTSTIETDDMSPFLKELNRLAQEKAQLAPGLSSDDSNSEADPLMAPPGLGHPTFPPLDFTEFHPMGSMPPMNMDMPPGLAQPFGFPPAHPLYFASLAAAMARYPPDFSAFGGYPPFGFPAPPPANYGAAHHAFMAGSHGRSNSATPNDFAMPNIPPPPGMSPLDHAAMFGAMASGGANAGGSGAASDAGK